MGLTSDKGLVELVEEYKAVFEQTLNKVEAQDAVLAKAATKGDLEKVALAVKQAEQDLRSIPQTMERKLADVRRATFGNSTYRGVFDDEQQARGFGLLLMSRSPSSQANKRAMEILKSEFSSLHALAMGESVVSEGGALVNTEYNARLLRLVDDFGVFTKWAFHMPMTSDTLTFRQQTGENECFLVGEGQAPDPSSLAFKALNLVAKVWGVLNYYPRVLNEDAAIPIAEIIARSSARCFAKKSDSIGFVGDGTEASFGMTGVIPRLLAVPDGAAGIVTGSGTTWSALKIEDFFATAGTLPQYASENARWFVHRAFFFGVMLPAAIKNSLVTIDILQGKPKLMLYGSPVEISQVLPRQTAVNSICALYGDMSYAATIGDRRQITTEESREYKFAEGQITVLSTLRNDIVVHSVGDHADPGPIVALKTASA